MLYIFNCVLVLDSVYLMLHDFSVVRSSIAPHTLVRF